MLGVTPTLQSAMRSAAAEPAVSVTIAPLAGGVRRLKWERLFTGSEPDAPNALAVAGGGAVLRARTQPGSPNDTLFSQHVANPGPTSPWGSWTSLETVASGSGVGLAAQGSQALLVFVDPGRRQVRVRESTDGGQSWGASVTAVTASADVAWVAVAVNLSGLVMVAYAAGAALSLVQRQSGVWGSPITCPHTFSSITGLALRFGGDWELAITGQGTDGHARVWTLLYSAGVAMDPGLWSSPLELTRADSGSGVVFRGPAIVRTDTRHLAFVEEFAGPVASQRPLLSHMSLLASFLQNLWREPGPFDTTTAYGVSLGADASWAWMSHARGVWRAEITSLPLEVSADVVELVAETSPQSGRLSLTLRNDHGRYQSPGSGELAGWTLGAELRLGWGYKTANGVETVAGPAYWIEGWVHRHGQGGATVVIAASDGWGLLQSWRARRTYRWPAGGSTSTLVLEFLLARAGLSLVVDSVSAFFANLRPAFVVHSGESGAEAVRRLLRQGPDLLRFRQEGALLQEPTVPEATTYTYGVEHSIQEAEAGRGTPAATYVQVFGTDVVAEALDWPLVAEAAPRLRLALDLNLTTSQQVQDRAKAQLEHLRREASWGSVTTTPHPGQELYDMVAISHSGLGLSNAQRRAMGWRRRYARSGSRARYEQRLFLGPPPP